MTPRNGPNLLFRRPGASEQVAQVADHARPGLPVAQEAAGVEFRLQVLIKAEQLGLVCRTRLRRHDEPRAGAPSARREPFVADQQHRHAEVERAERRVQGNGDDRLGQRDVIVVQARRLLAEEDPVASPAAARARNSAAADRGVRICLVM